MRPSTRNAIFVALGIAILGAELGAPDGDAKPARLADGALATMWPGSLSFLWGKAEATGREDVPSGTVRPEGGKSFGPGPSIEAGSMTEARRRSFTREAQRQLLAQLRDSSS
jgi:hypothetical protein